jgi:hypothetical protein
MKSPWRWRIQAFWRVGEEIRFYRPFYVDSEEDAERTVAEMRETLWHFIDLDIRVQRVDRASADAEVLREGLLEVPPDQS